MVLPQTNKIMEHPHAVVFPELYKNNAYFVDEERVYEVSIVLADSTTVYIDDANRELLAKILQSVKLSLFKAKVVNVENFDPTAPPQLVFPSDKIISFGVDLAPYGHLLNTEKYQLSTLNDKTYLMADALSDVAEDKQKKIQLWQGLKQLFG